MAGLKHDPHARPPDNVRYLFKQWQKTSPEVFSSDLDIIDTLSLASDHRVCEHPVLDKDLNCANLACARFLDREENINSIFQLQCFELKSLPGLFLYPSLIPIEVQEHLLHKLLHRDLSNPDHKTNLHIHYHMPEMSTPDAKYTSLFELEQSSAIQPRNLDMHKAISIKRILEKKLRWVTLGGQYDWTQKTYPDTKPPEFPKDVADLLQSVFPSVDPQAAILNFYSPGDTLSLHRDVSEDCDRGLISLSIGCEAIFMVANSDGTATANIRLRSGDVILMSGTCPEALHSWPAVAGSTDYDKWQGWLSNKRINLNVRQMRDEAFTYNISPVGS